jgi:toxin ParE1/3/4
MTFDVYFTKDAACDLEDIHGYIARNDSPDSAVYVINSIKGVVDSLYLTPERGVVPRELQSVGVNDFREIFFKPYRIIYQVIHKSVYIMLIVDGRRSLQSILESRLLR